MSTEHDALRATLRHCIAVLEALEEQVGRGVSVSFSTGIYPAAGRSLVIYRGGEVILAWTPAFGDEQHGEEEGSKTAKPEDRARESA